MISAGLRSALRLMRQEAVIWWRHRRGIRAARRYASARSLKLNVGCGGNAKPGWVNIDLIAGADLQLDLREPIPLADGSAQLIYAEHFFEHLDYPGPASRFLAECRRLLEPGGMLSIGVPDTRWPLLDYGLDVADGYFAAASVHRWHPAWCRTRLEHINYHFRQNGEHRFAWDFETLEQALREAGFETVRQREYSPRLDTASRAVGTLYVDATVPPTARPDESLDALEAP